MEKWAEARRAGDIPGAYWAVLTHPDVGLAGSREAFCDVHMLSHLVGAANRAGIRRLAACQVAATGEPGEDDAQSALRDLVADLRARLAREIGRREHLERRAVEAAEAGKRWEQRAREAEAQSALLRRELPALEPHQNAPGAEQTAMGLPPQRILYVGGRPGSVEQMRELLAAAGGELLCHDGGRHDQPSWLPGLISQADRVAFPVDCVSHDAALTVKRVSRQVGKAWLPLRSSGPASFLAALVEPIGRDTSHLQAGE